MRTLRSYVAREVAAATLLVFVALLLLFAFFDMVEQMKDLGRGGYRLRHIVLHVLLSAPNHVYELFPIAALIGTLFALAQFVASSEYTVMRASGVSLVRMIGVLATVGLAFGTLTFVVGEFIAPPAEQYAQRLRSQAISGIVAQEFRSGLWIKDGTAFVNVLEVTPSAGLKGVRIYDFDSDYRLRNLRFAAAAEYLGENHWRLTDIAQTTFDGLKTRVSRIESMDWQSVLDPALLNVLLVKPEKMSAWSLYSYSQHLRENRQKALRYEIAFLDQTFLSGGGAGDDGAGAAVRIFPESSGGRWCQAVCRHHARSGFPFSQPPVRASRLAVRLVADSQCDGADPVLSRHRAGHDVVAGAALKRARRITRS